MLNIIAEKVWNDIRWVSVTEDKLENIILSYVKDPDDMFKVKDKVMELSMNDQ